MMKKLLHFLAFLFFANFSFAQGIEFDGVAGNVTVCHDDNFSIGDGFTIEAWIFANEWKAEFWQGSIVNKDRHPQPAPNEGYSLRAGKDGTLSFVIATGDAWPEVISDPIMNPNQWYHIAGVYESGTASIYINGELVNSAPIPGTPSPNLSSDLTIGDSPGWPGRVFDGIIDEVRIWNVARTGTLNTATWADGYSIPAFDIGVSAITAPDLLSIFTRPTKVQATVQNYGSETVTSVPVELTINGLPTLNETFNINLPPGESATVVFTTPLDLTANTTNLVDAKTTYADDGNDLNDGLSYRYKKPSNDNIVNIINEEQHNFGGAGQTRFTLANLPENMEDFEQILIHFDVECPSTGCDPWDQTGKISVQTPNGDVEIARFITPYGIECGPWTIDVTDFKSILSGPVVFRSFIQVFGQSGWLLNCDMEFIEGSAPAYSKLNPLWETDYLVYGVEDNHNLWKDDCGQNICANQNGNWTPSRAGWCPGQEVQPYTFDLTNNMTPGQALTLDYELEAYTNLLNTGYNNAGHTEPHYRIFSYLVEESDTRYADFNNLRAESVAVSNDGTNFTGIDFTIKNTGSEPVATAMVSYYVDGEFVFEEAIGAPILAGGNYTHSFSSVQGLTGATHDVYAVVTEMNDENISDDVIQTVADLMSNVRELTKEELNIFPNPSDGLFQVQVSDELLNSEMEIIDIQGRVIKNISLSQGNFSFNIKEAGIYAISVKTENGRALFGRIVVQ